MAKKKTAKKKEQPFTEVTTGQEQPAKKGLIEELEELKKNGETSTARYKDLLKEAEVIFGTGEMNSFETNDPDALKERLSKMSKADLQTFSKKVGINPFYEKETVIDNKTGLLFESGKPKSLCDKLNEIIKLDTLTLDLMGREGRKNVINRFNIEKMCLNTYSEYKKLVN